MRSPLGSLGRFLQPGPVATTLAVSALTLMAAGAVGTLRSGRWPYRLALATGAALWPLPDHEFQGPVVLALSWNHGVHLSDLLSLLALAVAVVPARWTTAGRRRRRTRTAGTGSDG